MTTIKAWGYQNRFYVERNSWAETKDDSSAVFYYNEIDALKFLGSEDFQTIPVTITIHDGIDEPTMPVVTIDEKESLKQRRLEWARILAPSVYDSVYPDDFHRALRDRVDEMIAWEDEQ